MVLGTNDNLPINWPVNKKIMPISHRYKLQRGLPLKVAAIAMPTIKASVATANPTITISARLHFPEVIILGEGLTDVNIIHIPNEMNNIFPII